MLGRRYNCSGKPVPTVMLAKGRRSRPAPILAALSVAVLTACSKGGADGSTGPVTAPTPTPGQTQPPAVDVNPGTSTGQFIQLTWSGDVSFNEQTGTNTINFPQLTQTGSQVSGQIAFYGPDGGSGPFVGIISGTTLTFNFSIGNQGQGCGNTVSGSANVMSSTIAATFSGHRCNGQTYTNGKFTVSIPAPFRTSPYPVGGTWTTMNTFMGLGGGRWTFNIAETLVDVHSSNLTGSVAVSGGSLNLGTGSMTGAVTNTFPGPKTRAQMTVTFSGMCPSSLQFTVGTEAGNPDYDGSKLAGSASGTTCSGSASQGLILTRQ